MGTQSRTSDAASELPNREKLKSDAAEVMQTAKDAGQQRLETGKKTAAEQADKVADVLEEASSRLQDSDLQSFAHYADQIASGVKTVSDTLRNRSIDDLLKDTQTVARRNPTLFFLGSVAVGIAFSRFLKASGERQHENYQSSAATRSMGASDLPREPAPAESFEGSKYPETPEL
jgi:hypothetical protein